LTNKSVATQAAAADSARARPAGREAGRHGGPECPADAGQPIAGSARIEHNEPMSIQSGNPELEREMAKLFDQLGRFQALQQELTQAEETATAADGLVEVTVGPTGNLLGVTFNPRVMRLDSQSLTEAVMAAYQDACAQMGHRLNELMRPLLPDGIRAGEDLLGGTLKVMGPDGTAQDPMRAVREALERRAGGPGGGWPSGQGR
jgi:DNA-binding protein YbaB